MASAPILFEICTVSCDLQICPKGSQKPVPKRRAGSSPVSGTIFSYYEAVDISFSHVLLADADHGLRQRKTPPFF